MRDGKTQKLVRPTSETMLASFLQRNAAKLVVVSGAAAGKEIELRQERTVFGRGPGVDVSLNDPTTSRQHAVIEIGDEGMHIRDLGSTNGLMVNEEHTVDSPLTHGDHLEIGCHRFQIIIEEKDDGTEPYVLLPDA